MCLTCGDYSYPDAENHECIVDTCDSETEFLQLNGTCFTCEEGTSPNAELNGCMSYDIGWNRTGGVNYTQWILIRRGGWRMGHNHSGCIPREGCDLNDANVDCCDSEPLVENTTEPVGIPPRLEEEEPEEIEVPVVEAPTIYGTHPDP